MEPEDEGNKEGEEPEAAKPEEPASQAEPKKESTPPVSQKAKPRPSTVPPAPKPRPRRTIKEALGNLDYAVVYDFV